MKVFLAGIIQGSHAELVIHGQDWRAAISHILLRHHPDAEIYDHFAAHPTAVDYRGPRIRETLEEGNQRAASSDLVVCWLPEASMGTAVEMYAAFNAGAIVLVISPMAANWVIQVYSHGVFADLRSFDSFLAQGGLTALLARRPTPGAGASPTAQDSPPRLR